MAWDGINNHAYLRDLIQEDLLPTHSVCAWDKIVVAWRRDANGGGEVECRRSLGCSNKTKVLTLLPTC